MIRAELPWLFFFYLFLFLAVIFAVWISFEMARRFRENQALNDRTRCRACGLIYRFEDPLTPSVCPRCGERNENLKINIF